MSVLLKMLAVVLLLPLAHVVVLDPARASCGLLIGLVAVATVVVPLSALVWGVRRVAALRHGKGVAA